MKHSACILLLAVLSAPCLWAAQPITVAQAQAVAQTFVRTQVPVSAGDVQLAHVEHLTGDTSAAAFYVFNVADAGGWVIVSGDNRARQVLGYSDSGHLQWDNLPCNMRAWLDGYTEQLEWLQAHPDEQTVRRMPRHATDASTEGVAPLLTTEWSQSAPYYDDCPTYEGVHCLTGCVATAMAQIVNYYQYPINETPGLPPYITGGYLMGVDSLPPIKMAWDDMLDSYTATYTLAQGAAVAALMRYCGQSVEMNYGPSSSSASSVDVPKALRRTGYVSKEDVVYKTNQISTEQWCQYLNEELDNYRPVYYSATGSEGGHAFVLDGYRYDEEQGCYTYHINWGWGGSGNGYFPIDAMIVELSKDRVISFSTQHTMLQGLQPPNFTMVTMSSMQANPPLVAIDQVMTVTATDVRYKSYEQDGVLTFVMSDGAGETVGAYGEQPIEGKTGSFEELNAELDFPEWIEPGDLQLQLNCMSTDEVTFTPAQGKALDLHIIANVVKAGEPFSINDVNQVVSTILDNSLGTWSINDVNAVVNVITSQTK